MLAKMEIDRMISLDTSYIFIRSHECVSDVFHCRQGDSTYLGSLNRECIQESNDSSDTLYSYLVDITRWIRVTLFRIRRLLQDNCNNHEYKMRF
jgi:hypothetical protein